MAEMVLTWYQDTKLGDGCDDEHHCPDCEPNGNCDICDTVEGRWIGAVCEYASTCDGDCHELTHHGYLVMDPLTQLGYCRDCIPLLPTEIRNRLEKKSGINA